MTEIDHDRCSELLRSYARAELGAHERKAVASHLESCAECCRELAVVKLTSTEVDGMNPRERRRLHAAVTASLPAAAPDAGLPARRTWVQRFAPTLGAAALLLVAFVVALGGGEIGGDSGGDEGGEAGQAPAAVEDRARDGAGEKPGARDDAEDQAAAPGKPKPVEGTESDISEEFAGNRSRAPKPVFRTALVQNLGEVSESKVLERFADYYTVADAQRRSEGFLDRLSLEAPGSARDQVESCGDLVHETEDSLLPAAGALGRINDRQSLVLGFVYSKDGRGPLSSYMVWAWPRGSCNSRLGYVSGPLED